MPEEGSDRHRDHGRSSKKHTDRGDKRKRPDDSGHHKHKKQTKEQNDRRPSATTSQDRPQHQHQHQRTKEQPSATSSGQTQKHTCPVPDCGKEFSLKGNLVRHAKEAHHRGDGSSRFTCKTCGEAFTRNASLHRHEEHHDTGRRPLPHPYPVSTPAAPPTEPSDLPLPPEPTLELLPPPCTPSSTATSGGHPKTGGKSLKLLRQLQTESTRISSSTESEEPEEGERIEATTTIKVFRGGILFHQKQSKTVVDM